MMKCICCLHGIFYIDFIYDYSHDFYKRLHINTESYYQFDPMPAMPFLDKFSIRGYGNDLETLSNHLLECTEISLIECECWIGEICISEITVQNLMNMERLYLKIGECANILLFIKQSRNLKKIKLVCFKPGQILELDMLNTEREKLIGAHKVTIYVQDEVFLATKWAIKNGITNFPLIEMKRIDSFEWNTPALTYSSYMYCPKENKNS